VACSGTQPAPSTPTSVPAAKPTAAITSSPAPTAPTTTVAAATPAIPTPTPTAGPSLSPTPAPAASVSSPAARPTTAPVPVTASRIEVLTAANMAFTRGDSVAAIDLYNRVVNTPPTPGEAAELSTTINDFAHFRAMVALLAARRETDAREHLDALQERDPDGPFARLGAQLWDQYGMTGQLRPACAQLQPQIVGQAGPALAALQAAGVAVDPTTLCSNQPQTGGY
jgi:hypothetical protein